MSEHERLLDQLGEVLSKIARPYRCDDVLPVDVRASLWQLGLQCNELTSREELMQFEWGGPGVTPPTAA